MRSSLSQTGEAMPLNSIAPRPAKAAIGVNRAAESSAAGDTEAALSLVFEAIAAIGMSDKEAAYTMGLDPAQLSRIKSRQARLPFDALWRMPDLFWAELNQRVEQARGLSDTSIRARKAARISELVRLLIEEVA